MRTALILGSTGQVGIETTKIFNANNNWKVIAPKRASLDLANMDLVQFIEGIKHGPFGLDIIINCAAYTNVQNCELDEKGSGLNLQMNSTLPNTLSVLCKKHNIPLIHISTDYVFSGTDSKEYLETDPTDPLNEYGRVKLMGEEWVRQVTPKHYIIRTSWVYSENRNNFVKTMFKKGTTEESVNVVSDQIGRPTSAIELAEVIMTIAEDTGENYGTYHYGGSDAMSWSELSKKIFALMGKDVIVYETTTEDLEKDNPEMVIRPLNSVMSNEKITNTFKLNTLPSDVYLTEVIRRLSV
jgi:dTDP-4-dehydrorhamnose reductase